MTKRTSGSSQNTFESDHHCLRIHVSATERAILDHVDLKVTVSQNGIA
ncbi:hypothetical protein FP2506_16894 [Fulvimarina pelagi HTCC2506]|uniref:Uncharacterized protein n=1 Tax=Fulvimarina pelagi HTCC2506 TaxID=314231 RepID=Q0G2Q1_9HYPH|nr:hypothetical protein [Fulvimarina pelagi]EAU42130.1 hypothetical protein FP2506_16894 [Fulvimarina pelagi HTCC2506]